MLDQTPTLELPKVFAPLDAPARYKGAWGGRGSGKSHFFATKGILRCANEPGFRMVCVREVQRSIADSVKQLLEDKIAELGLEAFFDITESEIRGVNGSRIIFRGLQNHTAASIKSLEGYHVAWVEEAQTITQRSLDLLIPTIREKGSELWFSWNPGSEDDPVDQLLRADPPENAIVVKANWSDNRWFPAELKADMERDREREPDKYFHVWEGQYQNRSEARIFRNWEEGEVDVPDGARWRYGADWGFSVDPTAAMRCYIEGKKLYIDQEVYAVNCPVDRTPALLNEIEGFARSPSRADSSRPETIDFMRRNGFPQIRKARKGKGSVEHGITFLQGFDIVVHPRCVNMLHELANYAYKIDSKTEEILPVPEDKNNHLIDALRYAVEDLHREGKPIEEKPKPKRRRDYGEGDDDTEDSWKTL